MPKKPLSIDASTVLATKDKVPVEVSRSLQRGETTTKPLALDAQLKNIQLLKRAVEAYERQGSVSERPR